MKRRTKVVLVSAGAAAVTAVLVAALSIQPTPYRFLREAEYRGTIHVDRHGVSPITRRATRLDPVILTVYWSERSVDELWPEAERELASRRDMTGPVIYRNQEGSIYFASKSAGPDDGVMLRTDGGGTDITITSPVTPLGRARAWLWDVTHDTGPFQGP